LGISNPISAIIILGVFISVLFTMPGILESITSIQDSSSEISVIEDSIRNTNTPINNLIASAGSVVVNFTLSNNGTTKLWDYEKFDLIVTYDADIGGSKTKVTESMTSSPTDIPPVDPIIFDDVSHYPPPPQSCGSVGDECTFNHFVTSSGTDRILIVGITQKYSASITGVTYDGDPLMEIRNDDDGGVAKSSLWYLLDPNTGNNIVEVTMDASEEIVIGAMSFLNVYQSNPIDNDAGNTGLDDTPTVDITTSNGAWIVDNVATLDGGFLVPVCFSQYVCLSLFVSVLSLGICVCVCRLR